MSESLENFTNIVKEDIKEAKTLFFSEAFKEEYLKDRREEKELYHYTEKTKMEIESLVSDKNYAGYLAAVLASKEIVTKYFNAVKVMDENVEVQNNRISQLGLLSSLYQKLADLSVLEER